MVLQLYENKFSKEEQILFKACNDSKLEEYEAFVQIRLLSTVLAPKSKIAITQYVTNTQGSGKWIKFSKKSTWKPTKENALEGIIIHVKVPGDIENAISTKRKCMSDMGLSLQPFINVVGPDWTTVYVRVDAVIYEVSSILRGVDILLKVYLTFNLMYPPEAANLYYFVQ